MAKEQSQKTYNFEVVELSKLNRLITARSTKDEKRSEEIHFEALNCMVQVEEHNNLTPLTNYYNAILAGKSGVNDARSLRYWVESFTPAKLIKKKDGNLVFKLKRVKKDETRSPIDWTSLESVSPLGFNIEKETQAKVLNQASLLKRIEAIVRDIEKATNGEKENLVVEQGQERTVANIASVLKVIGGMSFEGSTPIISPEQLEEVANAA